MPNPSDLCSHTYTTKDGRTFICEAKPHARHPEQHYFVRKSEDDPGPERTRGSRMIRTPGRGLHCV